MLMSGNMATMTCSTASISRERTSGKVGEGEGEGGRGRERTSKRERVRKHWVRAKGRGDHMCISENVLTIQG